MKFVILIAFLIGLSLSAHVPAWCVYPAAGNAKVSGWFKLTTTQIWASLKGSDISSLNNSYHIHQYAVDPETMSCGPTSTGGHYNPYTGLPDQGIGELAKNFGDIPMMAPWYLDKMTGSQKDFPFPASLLHGRSIVIHDNNGARIGCCNIGYYYADGLNETACYFSGTNIGGWIKFDSATTLKVNITAKTGAMDIGPNGWHLHKYQSVDGKCDDFTTGGHFNPSTNFGEFSIRFGDIPKTAQGEFFAKDYTLSNNATWELNNPNVLGRSIVIHNLAGGARLACCNIGVYSPNVTAKAMMDNPIPTMAPTTPMATGTNAPTTPMATGTQAPNPTTQAPNPTTIAPTMAPTPSSASSVVVSFFLVALLALLSM